MPLTFAFFIYLNAWFVCLFLVLPFFVQSRAEGDIGYAAAPKAIRWKKALAVNSLVALVAALIVIWVISSGLFSLRG